MSRKQLISYVLSLILVLGAAVIYAKDMVEADRDALDGWYQDRDVKDAPALVQEGFDIIVNTPVTLGPEGYAKGLNGEPIVYSTLSCSSCHFDGGRVPEGIPFFQVRDKYAPPG